MMSQTLRKLNWLLSKPAANHVSGMLDSPFLSRMHECPTLFSNRILHLLPFLLHQPTKVAPFFKKNKCKHLVNMFHHLRWILNTDCPLSGFFLSQWPTPNQLMRLTSFISFCWGVFQSFFLSAQQIFVLLLCVNWLWELGTLHVFACVSFLFSSLIIGLHGD